MTAPGVVHLHQRSLLRIWLTTQLLIQVVFYAAFAGLLVRGLTDAGYLVGGALGLGLVFALSVVRSHVLLQPPLRIDLAERYIEARSGSLARSRLPFDVAETMELRTGLLHQLYLAPAAADGTTPESGRRSRRRYRLNLTRGGLRTDDDTHPLASLFPTPLHRLSDGVYAARPTSWGDAVRLACFLGVPGTWRAEPVPLDIVGLDANGDGRAAELDVDEP